MLTLDPTSMCDVCRDEYSPFNLPRSIPCGHVLCETCSLTIVEKTSPRLSPACPYCRQPFTTDQVRVIRVDYLSPTNSASTSRAASRAASPAPRGVLGWRSPRAMLLEGNGNGGEDSIARVVNGAFAFTWGARGIVDDSEDRPSGSVTPQHDEFTQNAATAASTSTYNPRDIAGHRAEAKRLEDRVGVVAAKRCSVEEVQALLKEIEEWLRADVAISAKTGGTVCQGGELMFTSLELSAALLHAILSNHKAHSDSTKFARTVEASLRERCEKSEREVMLLEGEVKKLKSLASQNKLEIAQLRADLARMRIGAPPHGIASGSASGTSSPSGTGSGATTPTHPGTTHLLPPSASPMRRQSVSAESAPVSPDAFHRERDREKDYTSAPTSPSPLSRHHSQHHHARTTSLFGSSSRPTTPSPATTAAGVSSRASPGMLRSMTPGPISSASGSAAERERERDRSGAGSVPPVPSIPPQLMRSMTPGRYHGRTMSLSHSAGSGSGSAGGHHHGRETINPLSFGSAASSMGNGAATTGAYPNGQSQGHGHGHDSGTSGTNASNTGTLSRPPVPPKPRLFSGSGAGGSSASTGQSPPKRESGSFRGVVDDRDGYASTHEGGRSVRGVERESGAGRERESGREKERESGRKEKKHERWFPRALGMGGKIARPATSMS